MRRLARMPHDVVHEVFLPGKSLFANVASMWIVICVLSLMIHHMLFAREIFVAKLTAEIQIDKQKFPPFLTVLHLKL